MRFGGMEMMGREGGKEGGREGGQEILTFHRPGDEHQGDEEEGVDNSLGKTRATGILVGRKEGRVAL